MISEKQLEILNKVIKKYKLDLVILFGSRAKKQERKDSDYDIAIYSKKGIKREKFWEIWSEIEGHYFPKIDLVLIDENIDPLLSKNIFANGVVLFEKEGGLFDNLYVNSVYNYLDYMPLYKIEEEIIKKKLESL